MTTMQDKIDQALSTIDKVLSEYKNPAVLCSFGKDSVALLHLLRGQGLRFPVIFYREPFFPAKYRYANQLIDAWNLNVYDYAPCKSVLQERSGEIEIVNHYELQNGQTIALPTGVREVFQAGEVNLPSESFLCGYKDLLSRPKGTMQFRWDVLFHGHKSSDVDPILGAVPLKVDLAHNARCAAAAYPLRTWTDADVWQYLEEQGVPIHRERYEKVDGTWREREDKTLNPDYFPACTRCMRRDGSESVYCPKMGMEVSNIAENLPWVEPTKPAYVG
jgi:hypothetical protein